MLVGTILKTVTRLLHITFQYVFIFSNTVVENFYAVDFDTGGKRKLQIPPNLAYGPEPAGCFSGEFPV